MATVVFWKKLKNFVISACNRLVKLSPQTHNQPTCSMKISAIFAAPITLVAILMTSTGLSGRKISTLDTFLTGTSPVPSDTTAPTFLTGSLC